MRSFLIIGGIFLLMPTLLSSQAKDTLRSQKEKASYCIGIDIGRNMNRQSLDVDVSILARGIKDGLMQAKPALTDSEMQAVMVSFQRELMAKIAEKNKKEGEAFLAGNKKKSGVVTLPSGLQYKVINAGTGKSPKATDTVTTHYRGTLLNGKEFDSSYKRGQPATFALNRVIAGWTEALQHMKVGSKWELYIPSNLAYGENGAGQDIGPNATLIFEVELLGVK